MASLGTRYAITDEKEVDEVEEVEKCQNIFSNCTEEINNLPIHDCYAISSFFFWVWKNLVVGRRVTVFFLAFFFFLRR